MNLIPYPATMPDYTNLTAAHAEFEAVLNEVSNNTLHYFKLFQLPADFIQKNRTLVASFNAYNPNARHLVSNVVSEDDLKRLEQFRNLLRIYTESTSLLRALMQLGLALTKAKPLVAKSEYEYIPEDLINNYKKTVFQFYRHATELAITIVSRSSSENLASPSQNDVALLTKSIEQAAQLYQDPNNADNYAEFSQTISQLPAKSLNIKYKLLVIAGALLVTAAFTLFVFTFPPLVFMFPKVLMLPVMLTGWFATPFVAVGGRVMIDIGLQNDKPGEREFFYKRYPLKDDLRKVKKGSKELMSQSALRNNSLFSRMQKTTRELLNRTDPSPQPRYPAGYVQF
jgi:hypothetical protein